MDGNGTLDCSEFLTLSIHLQKMGDEEHLQRAFKYFDKDHSGYIEFEELKQELFSDDAMDCTKSEQVIRDILFDADLDKVIYFIISFNLFLQSILFEVIRLCSFRLQFLVR